MTPDEIKTAAVALGELNVAREALGAAWDRLNSPLARNFVPDGKMAELLQASATIRDFQEGLRMLVMSA